jgi:Protein of unknown function (DUF3455)
MAVKRLGSGGVRLIACAIVLEVAGTVTLPLWAHAGRVTPPAVPANIQVPAGSQPFLAAHASGTQDYICLPSGSGFAWTFFAPQATLFTDDDQQVITHFLSPNPFESGVPRPTWRHSLDTSTVRGRPIASSFDPAFVARDAIPWLLIEVTGAQDGPTHGDTLTKTSFIQRVNHLRRYRALDWLHPVNRRRQERVGAVQLPRREIHTSLPAGYHPRRACRVDGSRTGADCPCDSGANVPNERLPFDVLVRPRRGA